jgi:hypothetical protein
MFVLHTEILSAAELFFHQIAIDSRGGMPFAGVQTALLICHYS